MPLLPVLLCAAAAAAPFSPREVEAARRDPLAFAVAEIELENLGPAPAPASVRPPEAPPPAAAPELDRIVNLGERLWKIVVDNKPVVEVSRQYATALPKGVEHWGSLAGWRPPAGTVYGLTARNAYGGTIARLKYQVLRTAGGSYEGKGLYLTAVTVEPLLVEAAWGVRVSLEASVPDSSVVNAGTSEAPLAGMMPQVAWSVATPVKESRGRAVWWVQGDGAFREVGGPFKRAWGDRVARAALQGLQ